MIARTIILSSMTFWTATEMVKNGLLPASCCHKRQQCRTKFRPFDKVETNWTCSICFERTKFCSTLLPNRQHCCQKWQQCRSNIRHCRKNPQTCTIWQRCLDCCWCGRGFYKVACCFDNVASTLLQVWTGLNTDITDMQWMKASLPIKHRVLGTRQVRSLAGISHVMGLKIHIVKHRWDSEWVAKCQNSLRQLEPLRR